MFVFAGMLMAENGLQQNGPAQNVGSYINNMGLYTIFKLSLFIVILINLI